MFINLLSKQLNFDVMIYVLQQQSKHNVHIAYVCNFVQKLSSTKLAIPMLFTNWKYSKDSYTEINKFKYLYFVCC